MLVLLRQSAATCLPIIVFVRRHFLTFWCWIHFRLFRNEISIDRWLCFAGFGRNKVWHLVKHKQKKDANAQPQTGLPDGICTYFHTKNANFGCICLRMDNFGVHMYVWYYTDIYLCVFHGHSGIFSPFWYVCIYLFGTYICLVLEYLSVVIYLPVEVYFPVLVYFSRFGL
jgi:hypothetical protein